MFCPQCKAEYRPGFTHCSDCDVDLVYELPAEPHSLQQSAELPPEAADARSIWEGRDSLACAGLCRILMDAGIRYHVTQRSEGVYLRMQASSKFQIAVGTADYDKAREVLGMDGEPQSVDEEASETDESEDDPDAGFPDAEGPTNSVANRDWDAATWFPEDATVEVFSEAAPEHANMIEMSLRENLIRCRKDTLEGGITRLFVLPQSERRAREIIHEIVDDVPSE
jgi:hypothetical protein